MYTKRIQIINYGPIDHLDITFPFNGENLKPILLVGENGSGKSVLLSYIISGLMGAQRLIYPENPEVEKGNVYKIRSPFYIKTGAEYYFGRVDFEKNLYHQELQLNCLKKEFPAELLSNEAGKLLQKIPNNESSILDSNFSALGSKNSLEDVFNQSCVLYFPPNRFEEPAWLNEENLRAKAEYMTLKHISGYTDRNIINYSPLHDNQNWLFEVLYDRCAFEIRVPQVPPFSKDKNEKLQSITHPVSTGYHGTATTIYESALSIVRSVFRGEGNLRFGIGQRQNRKVSLMQDNKTLVPNIFQLSSGETSLLNLFFSILRDFDLSGTPFIKTEDVRGTVIVDEIDLHLHTIHQHEILPKLMKMFPSIQFIVTTHSPLFILGMEKTFGQDGFALYRLPQGQQISPEEFSEFGDAYRSFTETKKFSDDMLQAVQNAHKSVVFVEGATDVQYLQKAAELLGQEMMFEKIRVMDGNGFGNLDKIWKHFNTSLAETIAPHKIVILYDCDKQHRDTKGNVFKRSIPKQGSHLLEKGIENLFEKATLERVQKESDPAFLDITEEHTKTERGQEITVPEKWTINANEKTNLCNWLYKNGTDKDFKHFQVIFNLLTEILIDDQSVTTLPSPEQSPQPETSHVE